MRKRRRDQAVRADERPVYAPSLTRSSDRPLLFVAFCCAVLLHGLALLISFPEGNRTPPPAHRSSRIVVKRYVPPPPKIERPAVSMSTTEKRRRIPIPDPTPGDPEPIREPAPDVPVSPVLGDFEVLIGDPTPPGPPGPPGPYGPGDDGEPLLAGVGGTTMPVRIEESYVKPEYPEVARAARVEGDVILQAVIYRDGTVGETEVLRCTRPAYGFEESAMAAVRQWRYKPATQNGQPVCVYFTILVEFSLV